MARTVVVTGGGTGIGRAVAARFAADGDNVYITGRRADVLKETATALGANVHALPCDSGDPDQVSAAVAQLPDRVDVLVNNAGGNTDLDRPVEDGLHALAAAWSANLQANLISAVLTTHALDDRLAEGGAVVHIGSIAGDQGGNSYSAAKAGLASWNAGLAQTLGARGITANVVAPGYIRNTEFFRDKLATDRVDQLVAATLTGRAGTPTDIAETVYFLTSPGARHITGQLLHVNGGARTTR